MEVRGTEFKVGLFTILALLVIGYMFFFLSPEMFQDQSTTTYYTIVKNASGIVAKTHVKTNGVIVGKVTDIELETNRTKISFAIASSVKIPMGSMVSIREKGLLGDVFLEIIRANDEAGHYLEPGGLIPHSSKEANLSNLIDMASSIGDDVKAITSSLAHSLGGESGKDKVASFINNLLSTAESAKTIAQENRQDIRELIVNLRQVSATVKSLLDEKQNGKIAQIIDKLDKTMTSVNLVMERIEKGQGTIGKLVNTDETLSEVNGMLKDLRELVAPASRLEVTVDYHGELRQDRIAQHYFNAYLQTRPDKFYLIGLTDSRVTTRETTYENIEGRTSEDAIPDPQGANPRSIRERIEERKSLRFNLQFGKRWGNVQMRFGLFESSGGIASDVFFFGDRARWSFEAFDWNNQSRFRRTAHFKTFATVLFFKHLYALVGIDDLSRLDIATNKAERRPLYYFGLGLSFRDEDLKSLLGAAALTR